MAHAYSDYKTGYEKLLKSYKVKPNWVSIIDNAANRIFKHRDKYKKIEDEIGVPWTFVAVIHNLESGSDFSTHLHNGDPLTARTKLVPRGYPKTGKPPFTWEESAVDALKLKGFHKEIDWSDAKVCYNLEMYNGFGYRPFGINSPYLWSGTTVYSRGKYVADGVWSSTAVSQQLGAIPLYKKLKELDAQKEKEEAKERKQLLKENSRSYQALATIKSFYKWATAGIASIPVMDYLGFFQNFLSSWGGPLLAIGGILLVGWVVTQYIMSRKEEEFKDGRYTPSGIKDDPAATE